MLATFEGVVDDERDLSVILMPSSPREVVLSEVGEASEMIRGE